MKPPAEPSPDCFRALVERSWDAVALLDAAGTVVYATPSTARILGYTPAEFVGRSALGLAHRRGLARATSRLLSRPPRISL